ncbi:ATP-binding protein, partial [Stomatobaculum longum]
MNIQEAKEEISRAIDAYLWKDESGHYRIPRERQRPILLMGAPGVGKTAIMRQLAEEKGLALVSYTISHHTRQSAIGLPVVTEQLFDGRPQKTTNYTMSEIVASVYEMMEKSGKREGILFLDEINTVSETLAPTMLQFLQYKTFGTHRVPDGWVI